MYKVINDFIERNDGNTVYRKGDPFPREGYNPSDERVAVLSSENNAYKKAFIEEYQPIDDMTVSELKEELKARGIDYDSSDKKNDLKKKLIEDEKEEEKKNLGE